MKQINICPVCGGKLEKRETEFVCLYCNGVFQEDTVQDIEEKMNNMLDKFKQELVANTRTQLWDAIHEKYLSSERILNLSRNIKTYLPDDFLANFFEFVNTKSHTQEQINEYINNIDYKEYYYLVDVVLDFMIKSLEPANLLCLNNLIENAYKQNYLKLYNEYTSRLAKEAEKVKSGVYDLTMERDVFVAYSSKDIKYVEEVVKLLNQEGISYFVALENLRHGKGAVENYDKALEQAMENSKTFLFISSENSRTRECDALKKEIPYLKKLDKLNAPAEYRNDYSKIPFQYKKPRVQLLIGDKPKGTLGDKQVAEVFDGYEWRYDAESAVEAIYNFLNEDFVVETDAERIKREFEENQAKLIEELFNKRMAEMMANQNKPKEPELKKEDSEAEKLRKEVEELKKALNDKNTVEKTNASTSKEPVKTEPVIQEETSKKQELKKPVEEKKNIEISNTSGVDASTKEEPKKTSESEETNVIEERKTITFGAYYRYNKKKEPLKWDILEEKDGKALIITHDIIEAKAFDENNIRNYKESSIRKWLNNEFYKTVFDDENKKKIQLTLVDNSLASTCEDNNPYVCEDTKDNIFLLSVSEIKTYFRSYDSRKASGTRYALSQGLNVKKDGNSPWFLRSPSHVNSDGQIRCVDYDGSLYIYGAKNTWMGIRPACWVDLENIKINNDSSNGSGLKEPKVEPKLNNIFKREGNVVTFGSYYDEDDEILAPLKWDILEEKDGKALIITHNIIDAIQFNSKSNNYEKSSIRKWLNNDFYNIAFSDEDKEKLKITLVDNSISSTGNKQNDFVCRNTKDKLFLLSVKETKTYYSTKTKRKAKGTKFAIKKGLLVDDENGNSWWWLRTPYYYLPNHALKVFDDGDIINSSVDIVRAGVRPACWIDLECIKNGNESEPKKEDSEAEHLIGKIEELKKILDGNKTKGSQISNEKVSTSIVKEERKTITFGSYFIQDDKKLEPLKWDILEEKNGKALIITHEIINSLAFNDEYKFNNYEKSSIRKWLNSEFYNTAFNDEEKKCIQLKLVDNSLASTDNRTNKYVCSDTKDNIFLLSRKEATKYYKTDDERQLKGTEFAKKRGLYIGKDTGNSYWLLRSPYFDDSKDSYCINDDGNINHHSYVYFNYGVRPACWIDLKKIKNEKEILNDSNLKESTDKKEEIKETVKRKSNAKTSKVEPEQKTIFKIEGNTITFGSYYNQNDKVKEPLKWNILEEKDGKALIITHDIIYSDYFSTKSNDYEQSSIRKFLNNYFYNKAFNDEERKIIQLTCVDNSAETTHDINNTFYCTNTNDNIFLLSYKEVKSYYQSNEARQAKATDYAKYIDALNSSSRVSCMGKIGYWWLRSPYNISKEVSCVNENGDIINHYNVDSNYLGIRPACWIILDEDEFNKKFKTSKNKQTTANKNDISFDIFKREGNTVTFGRYYNTNGKSLDPLKWDILEEQGDKALIITRDAIDCKSFDKMDSNNYEKSTIRNWINNDFYNIAFNDVEKKRIQLTMVDNSSESTGNSWNQNACENTEDNLFLLSFKEAKTYYKTEEARIVKTTKYVFNNFSFRDERINWWLRSPRYNDASTAYFVYYDGNIGVGGGNVSTPERGVRPACWIKITDDINEDSKELSSKPTENELKPKNNNQNIEIKPTDTAKSIEPAKVIKPVGPLKKVVAQPTTLRANNNDINKREGNTILFGSYYNKDYKTKESLLWDILEEKEGKALIITHNIIDTLIFAEKSNNYEKSPIRKWLNNEFYNIAFNDEEKKKIQLTLVDNSLSSTGDKKNDYICNDTKDNIFLLSAKEAKMYYSADSVRQTKGTEYAKIQGLYEYKDNSCWWLRSPYELFSYYAHSVDCIGEISGSKVSMTNHGVRPACWVIIDPSKINNGLPDKTKEATDNKKELNSGVAIKPVESKKVIKPVAPLNGIEKKTEEKEENKKVAKALLVSSSKLDTMTIADLAPYETIIIKDGEERLEKHLFGFAKNVKAVMIPNSIKSIGALCFSMDKENLDIYYDGTLTDWLKVKVEGVLAREPFNLYVRDPKGEVIRRNKNYTKIINLEINKDNMAGETIGSHQFAMSNIETVNISGIKVICEWAFTNCYKLKDVKLADVERISKEAFFDCYNLETVTLPKSLTDVSFSAFVSCNRLTTIYMKRKKPLLGLPKGFAKGFERDAKIVWDAK